MAGLSAALVFLAAVVLALALRPPALPGPESWTMATGRQGLRRLGRRLQGAFPAALADLRGQLVQAGTPGGLTAEEFLAIQVVAPAGGALLGMAAAGLMGGIVGGLLAAWLPGWWLGGRVKERQRQIEGELLPLLLNWSVAVAAGGDALQVLPHLSPRVPGVLAGEIGRTWQEIALGRSRSVALQELSGRCGVPDLDRVVKVLITADHYGSTEVSRLLRETAAAIANDRLQRAHLRAGRAAVAMVFPLILVIFPATLLMVLAPALWQLQGL